MFFDNQLFVQSSLIGRSVKSTGTSCAPGLFHGMFVSKAQERAVFTPWNVVSVKQKGRAVFTPWYVVILIVECKVE